MCASPLDRIGGGSGGAGFLLALDAELRACKAARDLSAAAAVGALTVDSVDRYPLDEIARAHDPVDAGGRGPVLVTIPQ